MTNKNSTVSVIIPTYNAEVFIDRTLDSVLKQTFKDFEIIIVDDCSTDGTRNIVQSYVKKYKNIRLIPLSENSGAPPKPKNIGIKEAKGEYVALLDHDDIWHDNKLKKSIEVLQETSADMVFSNSDTLIGEELNDAAPSWNIQNEDILNNCGWTVRSCSGVVLSKEALDEIGSFDESFKLGDDWDMWIRFVLAGKKIVYIPDVLYTYVVHEQNTIGTAEANKLLTDNLQQLNKHGEKVQKFYPKIYNVWLRRIATWYVLTGQYTEARSYLWQAISAERFNYKNYLAYTLSFFPWLYVRVLAYKSDFFKRFV